MVLHERQCTDFPPVQLERPLGRIDDIADTIKARDVLIAGVMRRFAESQKLRSSSRLGTIMMQRRSLCDSYRRNADVLERACGLCTGNRCGEPCNRIWFRRTV